MAGAGAAAVGDSSSFLALFQHLEQQSPVALLPCLRR